MKAAVQHQQVAMHMCGPAINQSDKKNTHVCQPLYSSQHSPCRCTQWHAKRVEDAQISPHQTTQNTSHLARPICTTGTASEGQRRDTGQRTNRCNSAQNKRVDLHKIGHTAGHLTHTQRLHSNSRCTAVRAGTQEVRPKQHTKELDSKWHFVVCPLHPPMQVLPPAQTHKYTTCAAHTHTHTQISSSPNS